MWMSVLCDVVRSMCIHVSIFWLPAPVVAVWRVSGMWGSVVGSLVCGARGMCSQ